LLPQPRLTIKVYPDDRFLVHGIEFSETQITVLAKEITARSDNARLHLRARTDVSTSTIKRVVIGAAEGGLTDVIFAAFTDDVAK